MSGNIEERSARREKERLEMERRNKIDALHRSVQKVREQRQRARSMQDLGSRLRDRYIGMEGKGQGRNWTFWKRSERVPVPEKLVLTPEEVNIFGEWLLVHSAHLRNEADRLEERAAGISGD